jgi:putative transcriptional regulator
MPTEIAKLEADLLESVRQMRRGQAARVTQVKLTPEAQARQKVGMSQLEFALLLGADNHEAPRFGKRLLAAAQVGR